MNREEFFTELAATAKEAQQAAPHSPTVALAALGGVVQKLAEELAYQESNQRLIRELEAKERSAEVPDAAVPQA